MAGRIPEVDRKYKELAEHYPILFMRDGDDYYVIAVLNEKVALMADAEMKGVDRIRYINAYNTDIFTVIAAMIRWVYIRVMRLREALEKVYKQNSFLQAEIPHRKRDGESEKEHGIEITRSVVEEWYNGLKHFDTTTTNTATN